MYIVHAYGDQLWVVTCWVSNSSELQSYFSVLLYWHSDNRILPSYMYFTGTGAIVFFRVAPLALGQSHSYDCTSASEATLKNMDKCIACVHNTWLHNLDKTKHNKTVCIFQGMYSMMPGLFASGKNGILYKCYSNNTRAFLCLQSVHTRMAPLRLCVY